MLLLDRNSSLSAAAEEKSRNLTSELVSLERWQGTLYVKWLLINRSLESAGRSLVAPAVRLLVLRQRLLIHHENSAIAGWRQRWPAGKSHKWVSPFPVRPPVYYIYSLGIAKRPGKWVNEKARQSLPVRRPARSSCSTGCYTLVNCNVDISWWSRYGPAVTSNCNIQCKGGQQLPRLRRLPLW